MGNTVKLQHTRRSHPTNAAVPYRYPSWVSRVRARSNENRGVALIEAAIVTPIFLMLIMALAEGGLFMRNYLGLSSTVRAGARSASAVGVDSSADLYIVRSIAQESAALPRNAIQYIVVYKATGFGAGPLDDGAAGVPGGCIAGQPRAGVCNVYVPSDFIKAEVQIAEETRHRAAVDGGNTGDVLDLNKIWFGCLTTGPHANATPDRYWCPSTRNNTLRYGDYVGVYMKIKHDWLTNIFGSAKTISDQSVIRMEPQYR